MHYALRLTMEKGLRQGRFAPSVNWQHERLRRAGASLLAASLLLSALPAETLLTAAAPLVWSEDLDAIAVDQPTEAANGDQHEADRPQDGASSVRQRGREAPIDLRQVAADEAEVPEAVGADPGDGPPPARKTQKSARDEQAARDARNTNIRIWPMPAESYTFTQAFGCVPQIAHFYQPGAGCPADRPVVHTGLDMAAPEGTPFYAAASGWVTESGYDREVGVANTRIIIQHEGRNDGYATEYLHWVASFVDVGDHVEAGQLIGEVGSVGYSTGPHLHFSLIDLDTGEHVDPTRWLPEEPGTEGYRGITPRRAAMRLPAGTTAGVPEHTDPSPPDVPVREDVPESVNAGNGNKGNKDRKKAKKREERRNKNGNNRQKDTQDISGKDGATSENGSAASGDKQADRERSRTRKRERNKNGSAQSKNASGEDSSGNSRKERKTKDAGDSGSGKGNKKSSGKDKNTVEQTDTRDKGAKGNKGNGNGGGSGGGKKKNRQQDDTQQAVEQTPTPADETPQETQEPAPGDTSGRDGQDGDSNADSPDDDRGNGGNGGKNRDESTSDDGSGGDDQTGSDGSASRKNGDGGDSTQGQGGNGGADGTGGDANSRNEA